MSDIISLRRTDKDGWRWYGNKVSVTTFLDQAVANPGLTSFFKNNSAKKIEEIRSRTSQFGTDVHALFEKILLGKDLGAYPKDYQPHIDTFHAWRKQHRVKHHYCELSLVSEELGIGGTCDFLGEIDGKLVVADWKITSRFKITNGWQIAAYRYMIKENLGLDVGMVGLQVDRRTALPKMFTFEHLGWCDIRFKAALEVFKGVHFTKLAKEEWPWLHKNALFAAKKGVRSDFSDQGVEWKRDK
jgi:hypothetical protein